MTMEIVKIKKPHQCFSCLRKFDAGTSMDKWSGFYQGDFNHGYTCLTCDELHSISEETELNS